jgi:hypothetical protein
MHVLMQQENRGKADRCKDKFERGYCFAALRVADAALDTPQSTAFCFLE